MERVGDMMMSYGSDDKRAIVDEVAARVEAQDGHEHNVEFVRRFLQRVPATELAEMSPETLAALTAGFIEFARQRVGNEVRFRAFNPRLDQHGWESTHTIIEIVNDDMPFLVDSVVLALSE